MSVHYKMFTTTTFAFEGITTPLSELIVSHNFEELSRVLGELKALRDNDSHSHYTEREVKELIRVLDEDEDAKEMCRAFMPIIMKVLAEVEDYNTLVLIKEKSRVCGELSEEAEAVMEKYASYRDDAKEDFHDRIKEKGYHDYDNEKTKNGLLVSFQHGALNFTVNGVSYRVLRFDSYYR